MDRSFGTSSVSEVFSCVGLKALVQDSQGITFLVTEFFHLQSVVNKWGIPLLQASAAHRVRWGQLTVYTTVSFPANGKKSRPHFTSCDFLSNSYISKCVFWCDTPPPPSSPLSNFKIQGKIANRPSTYPTFKWALNLVLMKDIATQSPGKWTPQTTTGSSFLTYTIHSWIGGVICRTIQVTYTITNSDNLPSTYTVSKDANWDTCLKVC